MTLRHTPRLFQPFANRIEVAPAVEPVLVVDLHTHVRLAGTAEDSALADLIAESRAWMEERYGIAFVYQTW